MFMATKRTKQARNPGATARKVETYLAKNPELREGLKLFDMTMKQYAQALSHLNNPQIITTASSTPV